MMGGFRTYEELFETEPDLARLSEAYAVRSTDRLRAISEFEELAAFGSAMSMIYLGDMYWRGEPPSEGSPADPALTEKWFKAAFDAAALPSISALGLLYGHQNRTAEAEAMFRIGVSNGDDWSMFWLAEHYRDRNQDYPEIRRLYEASMSLGNFFAKARLSGLMLRGRYGLWNAPRGVSLRYRASSRSSELQSTIRKTIEW